MKIIKKNSIAKNIMHLFYSTALSSGLNAVALIVLAYYLQSHYYGMFSVILAFAMIMGYFTDAGLSDIVLREGSKKTVDPSILLSSYIKMRMGLLVVTFVFGFIFIHLSNADNEELIHTAYFLIIPMVTGVALQSIATTFFQLMEKMQYSGLIRIISSLCLVVTLSIGMIVNVSPLLICTFYGLSYFVAGLFGIYLVSKRVEISLTSKFHKGLLQNLGSFTLGGLLFVILPHLGPLVLEKTLTLKEVGIFAVAYRIPQALQQIPFIVAGAYYPVLFRSFNHHLLDDHLKHHISLIKIITLVGMGMTIPFYHLSDFIIPMFFGGEWIQAAFPLKILSIMLTLQAVNIALADGLTTRSLQHFRTTVQCIAVFLGVFLYIFFSTSIGVIGGAIAGLAIETVALLGFWFCTPNRWIIAKRALIPYLSYFIFCLISMDYLFHSLPFLAVISNFFLFALAFLMDKEIRYKIKGYIKPLVENRSIGAKRSQEG